MKSAKRTLLHLVSISSIALVSPDSLSAEGDCLGEPEASGSAFYLDNDWILHPFGLHQEDRNYTMGISWQASGCRVRRWPIAAPFRWLDHQLGKGRATQKLRIADNDALLVSNTLDIGVSAFTPNTLELREPIEDDRPYASLLFADVQRRAVNQRYNVAKTTELSLAVYGLSLGKGFQRGVHRATQGDDNEPAIPEGWDNQVSDGGEPTARFGSRYQFKLGCDSFYDAQLTAQGNVGYYTNVGVGAALRLGLIASHWWQFDSTKIDNNAVLNSASLFLNRPQSSSNVQLGSADESDTSTSEERCTSRLWKRSREAYIWIGGNAVAWGYNGMLQGQFRKSQVRVSSSEIERLVYDYTIGGTLGFQRRDRWHRIGLAFSHRSPEADFGTRRAHRWGGIHYSTSKISPD